MRTASCSRKWLAETVVVVEVVAAVVTVTMTMMVTWVLGQALD